MGLDSFIRGLPKAELHMHLEGSIEAELLLEFAARNGLRPRWETAEALRAAYEFDELQSFLDLYLRGLPGPGAGTRFLRHDARLSAPRPCGRSGAR